MEAAILHQVPSGQRQGLDFLVSGCALLGVGLALYLPETASLTLLLPLLAGCYLRGARRAWLLPPLAALHLALQRSLPSTLVFALAGVGTVTFAVVTAERFRSTRRYAAELKRSLDVARHIQRALEPPSTVQWGPLDMASVLTSSDTLSGDFICLRPVGPDRVGRVLGDVTGKGVRAALAAAFVTGLYGELAREGFEPSAILEIISRRLHELFGPVELFVTMAALELDPRRKEWRAAVAGHDPPLRMRADGQVEELLERGMAAGILPDESYQEMRRPARVGDQIFLASDGLIPDGVPEGEIRDLLLATASSRISVALEQVVLTLQGRLAAHHEDDRTGLLIRLVED